MEKLDFNEFIVALKRKKVQIFLIIILFIILGCIYTFIILNEDFKSTTTLILGRENQNIYYDEKEDNIQNAKSEVRTNSSLIPTYSELMKSNTIIKEVKDNLKIEIDEKDLKKSIAVNRIGDTELIEITVKNSNPEMASDIANQLVNISSKMFQKIYNVSDVYIVDPATPAEEPYNINHTKDIAIFIIIGLICSMVYALIYSESDNRIKSAEEIEREIGLKALSSIPYKKENKKNCTDLISFDDNKSVLANAFETLRTNVQFTNINNKKNKVILITSAFSSEGKSYVSANLATAFAKVGKKVILIDADMRRGKQSTIFNIPNNLGLSNYLSGLDTNGMEINERINSFIKETAIKNLNVITSGNVPPNPSELLETNKLFDLIKDLSVFYDVIILDGPAVLPIQDSLVLARIAGSTLLVSLHNKTKKDELEKAKKDIQNVGGRVIGVVLNKVTNSEHKNYISYITSIPSKKENACKNKNEKACGSLKKSILLIKRKIVSVFENHRKKEIRLLLSQKKECEEIENNNISINPNSNVTVINKGNNFEDYQKAKNEEKIKSNDLDKNKNQYNNNLKQEFLKKSDKKVFFKDEKNLNDKKITNQNKNQDKYNLKNGREIETQNDDKSKEKVNVLQYNSIEEKNIDSKADKNSEKDSNLENRKISQIKKIFETKISNIKKNSSNYFNQFKEKMIILRKEQEEKRKVKKEQAEIDKQKKAEELKIKEEQKRQEQLDKEKEEKILQEIKEKEKLEEEKNRVELEKIREAEKIAKREQEIKLAEEREKERIEKEKQKYEEKLKRDAFKSELKNKKNLEREEKKKYREQKKLKQKEEARIQEELLEDNLYPKTKYNKNL